VTKKEETVSISDDDKDLGAADDELGDRIIKSVCVCHLIDNFITKFSRTLKTTFLEYRAS
jgi:hypothetical protein